MSRLIIYARLGTLMLFLSVVATAGLAAASDETDGMNLRRTHVVRVFQDNRDAVVNVNTTQVVRQRFGGGMMDDPFFRRFFNIPDRNIERTSLGSGFIVHAEGYVVTNAHVVESADEIEVILADGQHLPAKLLAADATHDLAVLKVDPPTGMRLRPVLLGDSSDLMIGEPVVAIGNPLGYEHTVTAGIVSAANRELPVTADWKLKGLIQTDASINPGNSGGPLLNAYGQVIGINTAIRGDAQNIGFAISVNHLRDLLPALMDPLQVNGVMLGGKLIEKRSIQPPAKVECTVHWQAEGDEQPGPAIRSINGRPIRTIVDACVALLECQVGEQVTFECDGNDQSVVGRPVPVSDGERLARAMLGLKLKAVSAPESRRFGLDRGALFVEAVLPGGPADKAGIRPGDLIVHVGRFRISGFKELAAILSQAGAGTPADVYVVRNGRLGRARLTLRSSATGAL